jgi:hypothetical protein
MNKQFIVKEGQLKKIQRGKMIKIGLSHYQELKGHYDLAIASGLKRFIFLGNYIATEYAKILLADLRWKKYLQHTNTGPHRSIYGFTKEERRESRESKKISKLNIFITGRMKRVSGSFGSRTGG